MDVLKDILDNLSDSIIILDGHGQIVLFNQEAVRVQKSVAGKPLQIGAYYVDIESPDRCAEAGEILDTVRRQQKPIKNFAECRTPAGASVFLERSFVPVLGEDNDLRYINVITQDITDRKLFEKKLRSATAEIRRVLDHAYAVVIHIDARGYILEWNDHVAEVTGWSKREMLSQQVREVLLDESHYASFDALMAEILANKRVPRFELPLRTRSGDEAIIAFSAMPRINGQGNVIGAMLVGQDVTELLAARRDLAELDDRKPGKTHFISVASHEFRSPLSSIDYAANFIKQHAATIGRKKLNEKVAVIEKHVNYMSHLLDDVLNYSRTENGRIKVVPEDLCLETFIRESVDEVTMACNNSHVIRVTADVPGRLYTDRMLLRNIVSNLLTNAIKFSPGRTDVHLTVRRGEDAVILEVADSGIGIPSDELDVIFEPFVRGKDVDDFQGTGLGLSIVKRAVELIGGTLGVNSMLGAGSVFQVRIPQR